MYKRQLHAGAWRNWGGWDQYHELIGGGTKSHEALQEFRVEVTDTDHAVTRGLPQSFTIVDELYRFEATGPIEVLAEGVSLETGERYPVLWAMPQDTLGPFPGRVLGCTLGHDGRAHEHDAYKTILRNGASWLEGK